MNTIFNTPSNIRIPDAIDIGKIDLGIAEYASNENIPYELTTGAYMNVNGQPAQSEQTTDCCYTVVKVQNGECYSIKTCLGQSLAVVFLSGENMALSAISADSQNKVPVEINSVIVPNTCLSIGVSNWMSQPPIEIIKHANPQYTLKQKVQDISADVKEVCSAIEKVSSSISDVVLAEMQDVSADIAKSVSVDLNESVADMLSAEVSSQIEGLSVGQSIDWLSANIEQMSSTIGEAAEIADTLISVFQTSKIINLDVVVHNGGAYDSSGTLNHGGAWSACQYTELVDVVPGQTYIVYTCLKHSPAICFFQEDGTTLVSSIYNVDPDYNFYEHTLVAPPNAAKIGASAFRSGPGSSLSIWIKTDVTIRNIDGLIEVKDQIEQIDDAIKIADYAQLSPIMNYFVNTLNGKKIKSSLSNPGTQYVMVSAEGGDTFYVTGNTGNYMGIAFFNSVDAIESSSPEQYFISGISAQMLYDQNIGTPYVESFGSNKYQFNDLPIKMPDECRAFAWSTWDTSDTKIKIPRQSLDYNTQSIIDRIVQLEHTTERKLKYIAFGDSWTKPSGTVQSLSTVPYPECIQRRTSWEVLNYGASGTTMVSRRNQDGTEYKNEDFSNCYINYLPEISSANCLTFAFGINENNPSETMQFSVGDKNSTEISSIWGAWNTVLSAIYDINPGVKIGMILNEGITKSEHINVYKNIAQWWGIPVLDMSSSSGHSPILPNNFSGYNPYFVQKRNAAFNDGTNHPNNYAHLSRSYSIQQFIESL